MQSEAVVLKTAPRRCETCGTQRSLVRKLAEVMAEVARVPKSGHNAFHNYDYATEADIADAVRAGLAQRAVMIIPSVKKEAWETLPSQRGSPMKLCTLTVEFTLEDGDSGETRLIEMIGQGTDQGDKASYKAMTGAEKYALMKLFLISTGHDPEKDEPGDAPPANRPPNKQPPPQSRPPAAPAPQQAPPRSTTPPAAPVNPTAVAASPSPTATTPAGKDPATATFHDANRESCAKTGHEYDLKTGICDGCGAQMPKTSPTPEKPPPSPQSKQSPELRARAVRVWKAAQAKGMSLEGFQGWSTTILGRATPSSEWTTEDVERLEVASQEPPAREPGAEG